MSYPVIPAGTRITSALLTQIESQTPLLPSLGVYRNAALSQSGTSALTMLWDSESWQDNVAANAMHSTSTNTDRLIAPVTGKYAIKFSVEYSSNASAPYLTLKIQLNGSSTGIRWETREGVASQTNQISISTEYKLNASDYVQCVVTSSISGHSLVVGATTCFGSFNLVSG